MRRAVVAIVTCLVPGLAMALACGRDPVVVATIEASDAAIVCGTPDAGAGCPDGLFCERSSCDDASAGLCQPVESASCVEQYGPQCGCDRVSYYNACRRRAASVIAKDDTGPCTPDFAEQCLIGQNSCGENGVCEPTFVALPVGFTPTDLGVLSQLTAGAVLAACSQPTMLPPVGMCWVPPKNGDTQGQVYSPCKQRCISAVTAIVEGGIYLSCPPDGSTD